MTFDEIVDRLNHNYISIAESDFGIDVEEGFTDDDHKIFSKALKLTLQEWLATTRKSIPPLDDEDYTIVRDLEKLLE